MCAGFKVIPVVSPLDVKKLKGGPHLGGSKKNTVDVRKRISSSAAGSLTGKMAKRMCYGRGLLACKLRLFFPFFGTRSHIHSQISQAFWGFSILKIGMSVGVYVYFGDGVCAIYIYT